MAEERQPDEAQQSGGEGDGKEKKLKRRPRSHVRRAHWHHFWVGPMKGERELVVKWLHPAFVNVEEDEELPAVVRGVG